MRLRIDAVFVSSVLFTLALLWLVPHNLQYASSWPEPFIRVDDRLSVQNYWMPIGFAALTLILVGLIVIWTGYIRKDRWAWLIMLIIVWVFAFPIYLLPILQARLAAGSSGWPIFWDAIKEPGVARASIKGPVDFVLLLVALLMPVRSFFGKQSPNL